MGFSQVPVNYDPDWLDNQIRSVTLLDGQEKAVCGLIDWYTDWKASDQSEGKSGVLKGTPGTGKTFTLAQFILRLCQHCYDGRSYLRVILSAPTNQAKENIRDFISDNYIWKVAQTQIMTIHAHAGLSMDGLTSQGYANELWLDRDQVIANLLIIDEYSMLHPDIYDRIKDTIGSIPTLFVGDINQLEFVDTKGGVYPPGYSVVDENNSRFQFVLSETKRFSGPILSYTQAVLSSYESPFIRPPLPTTELLPTAELLGSSVKVFDKNSYVQTGFIDLISDRRFWDQQEFAKILCYTNKGVSEWNRLCRKIRFGDDYVRLHEGEWLIVKETIYAVDENGERNRFFYTNQRFRPHQVDDVLIDHPDGSGVKLTFQRLYAENTYRQIKDFLIPSVESLKILTPYFLDQLRIIKQKHPYSKDPARQKASKSAWDGWEASMNHFGLTYKKDPDSPNPIKRTVIPYCAATVHSMQGSTIQHAVLDWGDLMKARDSSTKKRLVYVGSSRPSDELTILT